MSRITSAICLSRPSRTRGLKLDVEILELLEPVVASLADAWIETYAIHRDEGYKESRPSRTRGLKRQCVNPLDPDDRSRPSRTRGLKLNRVSDNDPAL